MSKTDTPKRVCKVTLSGFSVGLGRSEKTWRLQLDDPSLQADHGCVGRSLAPNFERSAEGLAYTVGFAHRTGIDSRDIQATRMAKRQQCLLQLWEADGNGAAVSAAAND